ncbi:hypothetical protein, partial [Paracoccus sp. (in: a-proteobacteria)]|uniref:hypothetical protein n=1 Tax=Paracoccus sp. TaxID=267 RepID=UPI0028B1E56E
MVVRHDGVASDCPWAIGAAVAAWLKGRLRGRADAQAKQDAAYRETRERIDAAGNDVDGAS